MITINTFVNHASVLKPWLLLDKSNIDTIIHIDKHSDMGTYQEKITCGNFLTFAFVNFVEIKRVIWLYPCFFIHKKNDYYFNLWEEQVKNIEAVLRGVSSKFIITMKENDLIMSVVIKNQEKQFIITKNLAAITPHLNNSILDIDIDYLFFNNNGFLSIDSESFKILIDVLMSIENLGFFSFVSSHDGAYAPLAGVCLIDIFKFCIEQKIDINKLFEERNFKEVPALKNKFQIFEKHMLLQYFIDDKNMLFARKYYYKLYNDTDILSYIGSSSFFSHDGYIEQAIIHDRFMLDVDPENPFFYAKFLLHICMLKEYNSEYKRVLNALCSLLDCSQTDSYYELLINISNRKKRYRSKLLNLFIDQSKKEINKFYTKGEDSR